MTKGEIDALLGRWKGIVPFENHDPHATSLINVGTTSLGTEIRINRTFIKADLKILTGDVEYHQFCGYGGGAKSVYPGLASAEAIRQNHSRLDLEGTGPGLLAGNPVRAEIDEVGRMVGVDFLLTVVLDPEHKIVSIHAGDLDREFRKACEVVDRIYRVETPKRSDLVIATPGGHPKDLTLYQSQKAIAAAVRLVKPGGRVVILAECKEGSGSDRFENWMEEAFKPDDIHERIRNSFQMGGHKAYQIAQSVKQADIYFYSSIVPGKIRSWFMEPLRTLEDIQRLIDQARKILILPQATTTLTNIVS
jgi:nickel-dependent lactate racemase